MPYQGKIYGFSLPNQFRIPSATQTQDGVMTAEQVQLLDSLAGGGGTIPQPANTFYAGPIAGPDALPQFRYIILADLPPGYPAGDLSGVVGINAGGTNSGAALSNNRAMLSVGGAIVESNASTSSQVLIGGSPPAFGDVPAAAIPNTPVTPGSYPTTGQISTFDVAADGRLIAAGSTTDGSALTTLNASNLASGTVDIARIPTGTSASTVTIGNDARLNPAPSAAGKVPFDTGAGYNATAAGTSVQVLHGGATPGFSAVDLTADVVNVLPVANGGTGSSAGTTSSVLTGLTLFATPVAGEIGYASSNNTVSRAIATSLAASRAVGVYAGTANTLSQGPRVGILLEAGLNAGTPPAAGQPIFVSASVAGRGTNVAPSTATQVEAQVAILLDATGYNNATGSVQDCVWQVTSPIQL